MILIFNFLLVLISIASFTPVGQALQEDSQADKVVTLGGLFSVHANEGGQCGQIRTSPFINVQAMIYAVDRINRDSDILPNVTLVYDIRDTCGVSNKALEEAIGLIEIHDVNQTSGTVVSGVVGAAQSDVSISVASLLRIFRVPQISHSSTAALLSDKQRFDYFFRTIPPDTFQARAIASLVLHFNWSYIIGVHTDDTYGRGGIQALAEELRGVNDSRICMVTSEATAIPLNALKAHYDRVLDFIQQSWVRNASVVVLFVQQRAAVGLLEAIGDNAASFDHITWIASDAWATRVPVELHDKVRGMLGVVPLTRHVDEFHNYYESLTPENNSGNPWFNEFWENEFNCSLDQEHCGEQRLTHMYSTSVGNGVAYVIDAVYAFAHAIQNLIDTSCPNSTGLCDEILTERFTGMAIDGEKLRESLFNVSFISPTMNKVIFDEMGDQKGFYQVMNLGRGGLTTVGVWNSRELLEITGDIEWRDNGTNPPDSQCSLPCELGEERVSVLDQSDCCWTCRACPADDMISTGEKCEVCNHTLGLSPNERRDSCEDNPIVHLTWSYPWGIVIVIGSLLGLAATAFVAVIFIVFNKHKIIKASSRELSAILLVGITLCYITPFFFMADPSPATCGIRRFSIGFCFCLCFSPLLMRTNRIYRVFHQAPRTPHCAGSRAQVVFTCLLVSVQVVVGAVWLTADRPRVAYRYYPRSVEKVCAESPYVGLAIHLLYNLFLLTLATFYAFLGRKIPAKFNETKYIVVTLYSLCVIWLAFIPTYFATIVRLGVVHQTGTLLSAVLFSGTTTLACLFCSKVILLFAEMRKERKGAGERRRSSTTVDYKIGAAEISSATLDFKLSTDEGLDKAGVEIRSKEEDGDNNINPVELK